MLNLVINRKRWYRGKGAEESSLRRGQDGKQCCLGFLCRALGVPAVVINNERMPDFLPESYILPRWLRNGGTSRSAVNRAATLNDDPDLTAQEREGCITRLFRLHGIRVKFTN